MDKRKMKTYKEIENDYFKYLRENCQITNKYYKEIDIIDENKSIKWNEDEKKRRNKEYFKELEIKNKLKKDALNTVLEEIYILIQTKVKKISKYTAERIWLHALQTTKLNLENPYNLKFVYKEVLRMIDLINEIDIDRNDNFPKEA